MRTELERIKRVSDSLCTGHAKLRDRFMRLAFWLDLCVIALSTWIVALVFVEPRVNLKLTPPGWDPQIWIGVISILSFFLTIVQFKTDWKSRADAHKRTLDIYAEVKREAGYVLAAGEFDEATCRRVLSRYDMASAIGIAIPEKEFLVQKRNHLTEVALSRYLDNHPSASILMMRMRFWFRDNMRWRQGEKQDNS